MSLPFPVRRRRRSSRVVHVLLLLDGQRQLLRLSLRSSALLKRRPAAGSLVAILSIELLYGELRSMTGCSSRSRWVTNITTEAFCSCSATSVIHAPAKPPVTAPPARSPLSNIAPSIRHTTHMACIERSSFVKSQTTRDFAMSLPRVLSTGEHLHSGQGRVGRRSRRRAAALHGKFVHGKRSPDRGLRSHAWSCRSAQSVGGSDRRPGWNARIHVGAGRRRHVALVAEHPEKHLQETRGDQQWPQRLS